MVDRGNGRIVVLDQNGDLLQIIAAPRGEHDGFIPEDFRYRPRKVGVDQADRLYVSGLAGYLEMVGEQSIMGILAEEVMCLGHYRSSATERRVNTKF